MGGILIDIIIIAIIAICILIGYKRGLSASIFRIISFALAIILTVILAKPVSDAVMKKTNINETIKASIVKRLNSDENKNGDNQEGTAENQKNSADNKETEKNKNTKHSLVDEFYLKVEDTAEKAKGEVVEITATEISNRIVEIGIGILLFLVIRLILLIVSFILNFVVDLPIIKQIDKIGGIVYGALQGFIIIYVMLAIISFISVLEIIGPVEKGIQKSNVGSALYNNNLIIKLLK